jgi:regulatory protein
MAAPISEAEDPLGRALALAYRQLARRERTVSEVRTYLLGRGAEAGVTDAAIDELREQRYLDDARFARAFVEDKRALAQWGTERIRRGLQERGIDRELVDAALATTGEDQTDELERALALLRARFSHAPRDRRERERALGLLVRRGYEYELAVDAIRAYASAG